MINAYQLPYSLNVNGVDYAIRTDFRVILDILEHMGNPEYEDDVKIEIMLRILFLDWQSIPTVDVFEAAQAAIDFIDMGLGGEKTNSPRLMDWQKDAPLILPAVNNALGVDVRGLAELHWWTFLGAYMNIGESLFSEVVYIRSKKARGEKLEKHELKFLRENYNLISLPEKYTSGDIEMLERWGIQ